MMRSLNTSATGMVAQQYNLDIISNNLANVNTTAFKQQRAEFQDLMYQTFRASGSPIGNGQVTPLTLQIGLGSSFSATASNFGAGPLSPTGNALDVAISGEGFFRVLRPDGSIAYTRDGSFKRNAEGLIVTSDGHPLDPAVTIPPNATALTIAPNGIVSAIVENGANAQEIGNVTVTVFPNPSGLRRIGQNLFTAGGASGDPQDLQPGTQGAGELRQNFLESSNVQVVEEMVRMIMAQRAYEINSKAIQTADDMLGTLNGLKR